MDFEHFGLSGRPFQLTPDPRFWFETDTHRKAMAYLGYGLSLGEGFIVITGDIGAGKTTLVGHLLDTIDRRRLHAIRLVSTALEADDLLRVVLGELGGDPAGLTKGELLPAIERGLHAVAREAKRTLLVVDEAQALSVGALEELRMLSNFQAGGHALLQIVLVGQPEFRERLNGSDRLEQLRQRVIAIHHLDPMEEDEVADYVAHRLSVVGWQGRPDFAADAFPALHAGSAGVPRRLNLLAGRVMLHAAIEGIELIDGAAVEAVVADLAADLPSATAEPECQSMSVALPSWQTLATRDAVATAEPADVEREADDMDQVAEPAAAEAVVEIEADEPSPVTEPAPADAEVPCAEQTSIPTDENVGCTEPVEPSFVESELARRIAALEARVETQDAALRRVLTLLVDWVEADAARAPAADDRDTAPVPIRGAAAWDHAA